MFFSYGKFFKYQEINVFVIPVLNLIDYVDKSEMNIIFLRTPAHNKIFCFNVLMCFVNIQKRKMCTEYVQATTT